MRLIIMQAISTQKLFDWMVLNWSEVALKNALTNNRFLSPTAACRSRRRDLDGLFLCVLGSTRSQGHRTMRNLTT
jgi:hypothetical protein